MFGTGSPYNLTATAVVTPPIATVASGQCISTPVTVSNWAHGVKLASLLTRVRVIDPQGLNGAMTLYFFNVLPASPFTASGVFASQVTLADIKNLVRVISVPAGSSVSTGAALTNASYQHLSLNPAEAFPVLSAGTMQMFVVPVAAASIVFAAATPISIYFDLLRS